MIFAPSVRPWPPRNCAAGCRPSKTHRVQTAVGHYGVFSGRRWTNEVYPLVRDIIHINN